MTNLSEIREEWYRKSVEEFGEEETRKMWTYAKDPVTGYRSRSLNSCNLLNNEIPCQRCGGFGIWGPVGSNRDDEVLCVRCHDDWSDVGSDLLEKHGYVSSKKKWHAAFIEFCSMKPAWLPGDQQS